MTGRQLRRREFLTAVGTLSAASLLGACGGTDVDSPAPTRPPTGAASSGSRTSEVLLFHHAQGLTPGVLAFADELRAAGHTVHTPDLLDGRTFDSVEDGVAYAREVGFDEIVARGEGAAAALPAGLVYAGFSLGVMPAQKLAQTRGGAHGALLVSACLPVSEYGTAWPAGVPAQVHAMDADPFFVDGGDLDAARTLVSTAEDVELFLYPGDQHLFADSSLPSYVPDAAAQLRERVLAFLGAASRT